MAVKRPKKNTKESVKYKNKNKICKLTHENRRAKQGSKINMNEGQILNTKTRKTLHDPEELRGLKRWE